MYCTIQCDIWYRYLARGERFVSAEPSHNRIKRALADFIPLSFSSFSSFDMVADQCFFFFANRQPQHFNCTKTPFTLSHFQSRLSLHHTQPNISTSLIKSFFQNHQHSSYPHYESVRTIQLSQLNAKGRSMHTLILLPEPVFSTHPAQFLWCTGIQMPRISRKFTAGLALIFKREDWKWGTACREVKHPSVLRIVYDSLSPLEWRRCQHLSVLLLTHGGLPSKMTPRTPNTNSWCCSCSFFLSKAKKTQFIFEFHTSEQLCTLSLSAFLKTSFTTYPAFNVSLVLCVFVSLWAIE